MPNFSKLLVVIQIERSVQVEILWNCGWSNAGTEHILAHQTKNKTSCLLLWGPEVTKMAGTPMWFFKTQWCCRFTYNLFHKVNREILRLLSFYLFLRAASIEFFIQDISESVLLIKYIRRKYIESAKNKDWMTMNGKDMNRLSNRSVLVFLGVPMVSN